ncbi:MAG: potassium channel protein [Candidatus Binataceae bacterium]
MSTGRRLILALAIISFLALAGTAGFMLIEGLSLIDALYMAVNTISTVGFGEVKPLSPAGRMFTIVLIVTGVGTALYLFAVTAEMLIEGHLREYLGRTAMERKIHQLEGHVVICGYGRFGRVVAEELARNSIPLVAIDHDPAKEPELTQAGLPYLIGSALEDAVLEHAQIRRARAIVIATASDADNVYITLSAREKNPPIRIHARGESEAGLRRLKLAGADQAISAYQWGGMRMASSIIRPSVVDFLELAAPGRGDEVDLEQIMIAPGSSVVGKTIRSVEAESPRLRIVALKRRPDAILLIPDPATTIAAEDSLVVIGERAYLKKLTALVGG